MVISWQEMQNSERLVHSMAVLTPPHKTMPNTTPMTRRVRKEHFAGFMSLAHIPSLGDACFSFCASSTISSLALLDYRQIMLNVAVACQTSKMNRQKTVAQNQLMSTSSERVSHRLSTQESATLSPATPPLKRNIR